LSFDSRASMNQNTEDEIDVENIEPTLYESNPIDVGGHSSRAIDLTADEIFIDGVKRMFIQDSVFMIQVLNSEKSTLIAISRNTLLEMLEKKDK
jgi:hypothetical protein